MKWADNIYVGGNIEKDFVENIEEVCQRMKILQLRAAPAKTILGIEETSIMGWIWKQGKPSPSTHKLNPLCSMQKLQLLFALRQKTKDDFTSTTWPN